MVWARCGKTISRRKSRSITKARSLSIAGLVIYLPAIFLPLIALKSFVFSDSASIIDLIINFYQNVYYLVSLMVLLSAVTLPFELLSSIFIISGQLYMKSHPPYLTKLFRNYLHLEKGAMLEVYLLGIMVTIIIMADSSNISYHIGTICFTTLVLLTCSGLLPLSAGGQCLISLSLHSFPSW